MTYLLDTDVLIYFSNKKEPWYSFICNVHKQEEIFISIITVMEICAGWSEKQRDLYLPELYDLFAVAPITNGIAEQAGLLRYDGKHRETRKPKPMDALIAATALEHKYCLVTNNAKDYAIPGLEIYKMPRH